ncbi:MAG: sulfur carrier protein ThiS [Bacteroidales bacterium]|jgi:thiamine biosynthesis protein ThiS|nr:sulfur carrier protein ThiS [Bacteroidales bacterium]
MKIFVNKKERIVPVDCSVKELAAILSKDKDFGIAIAIGSKVVSREQWETTMLKEADAVTIIEATCGG